MADDCLGFRDSPTGVDTKPPQKYIKLRSVREKSRISPKYLTLERTLQPAPTDSFTVQRMGTEDGPYTFMDLQIQMRSGALKSDTMIRKGDGPWFNAKEVPGLFSDKEWLTALLLSVFVGSLGVDRFYLGQTGLGILKLLTCGGVGVWYLIDIILIATNKVADQRGLPLRK